MNLGILKSFLEEVTPSWVLENEDAWAGGGWQQAGAHLGLSEASGPRNR